MAVTLATALDDLVASAAPAERARAEDVRWAIETLASDEDAEARSGAFLTLRDACVGLYGDALVASLVPAVVLAAGRSSPDREWIARRLVVLQDTARAWRADDARRAHAFETEARIRGESDRILGWIGTPLHDTAVEIARHEPTMHAALVARLAALPALSATTFLALAALAPVPAHCFDRARDALGDGNPERAAAAAILLQRAPDLDDALRARIDDVLGPTPEERWRSMLGAMDCRVLPLPMTRFRGSLQPAEVVFVGARSTSLRRQDGGISTIPAALRDARAGDTVRIGLSPQGIVRVVEHAHGRLDLDLRGQPIELPAGSNER